MALPSRAVSPSTVGDFLRPEGFERPHLAAVLREGSVVGETGRYAVRSVGRTLRHRPVHAGGWSHRDDDPVLLVPGFMAGDGTLALMARALRNEGLRTYRSHIRANVGCTLGAALLLEARLQEIATRRGSRVRVVGHSLGGLLARGVAARRPDLVSGIVTMGSPVLAPGAHHLTLAHSVEVLVRLSRAGVPGLMSEECVAGACARQSFDEARMPLPVEVANTSVYSRRDGVVDWRACIDPGARAVEVRASHCGMAVDPRVLDVVLAALRPDRVSAVEVDRGEIA